MIKHLMKFLSCQISVCIQHMKPSKRLVQCVTMVILPIKANNNVDSNKYSVQLLYITYCVEYCVNCSLNTHYITMLTETYTTDIV